MLVTSLLCSDELPPLHERVPLVPQTMQLKILFNFLHADVTVGDEFVSSSETVNIKQLRQVLLDDGTTIQAWEGSSVVSPTHQFFPNALR